MLLKRKKEFTQQVFPRVKYAQQDTLTMTVHLNVDLRMLLGVQYVKKRREAKESRVFQEEGVKVKGWS